VGERKTAELRAERSVRGAPPSIHPLAGDPAPPRSRPPESPLPLTAPETGPARNGPHMNAGQSTTKPFPPSQRLAKGRI
jgi:hypothetical protein